MDLRRLALAVACALVLALAVVGLALAQRSPAAKTVSSTCRKPFTGLPPLSYDLPARYQVSLPKLRALGDPATDPLLALALTEQEYDSGQLAAAKRDLTLASVKLGGNDTRVTVGSAMLSWRETKPTDVERTLEGLASDAPRDDGLPLVQRGIVALWQGCASDAADWFAQTKSTQPDSFYSTLADNLLHPEQNAKYPPFISNVQLPAGSLATRRASAKAHPGDPELQLAYAVALQGEGLRTLARAAASQAVAADPRNLDAQVAAIVLGYDKDNPSTAVGALGGLIKQNPNQIGPVLHLGILLLWIKRNALALTEFQKAVKLAPASRDGKVAAAFVRGLRDAKG